MHGYGFVHYIRAFSIIILLVRLAQVNSLHTIHSSSKELKTNPHTVTKAYEELEIRGILIEGNGSRTYIFDKKFNMKDECHKKKIWGVLCGFLQEMESLGVKKRELITMIDGINHKTTLFLR
jgi:DNA-binding transcriptional regulator YhcF (GntR family)